MHPTFYFTVWFVMITNSATSAMILLFIKTVDIATKLWLVQKVEEGSISPEFKAMFSMPLSPVMMWMNVFIYPALLAFSVA